MRGGKPEIMIPKYTGEWNRGGIFGAVIRCLASRCALLIKLPASRLLPVVFARISWIQVGRKVVALDSSIGATERCRGSAS